MPPSLDCFHCVNSLGEIIRATISIGVVQRTEESLDQLIERADKALYQEKANGRTCCSHVTITHAVVVFFYFM
nr:diguanylate cyclase [Paenibacillus periandrae]